jgi:hypothetical protein
MKYLKDYNEASLYAKFWRTVNLEPLKELCENSLIYLLDEDFELVFETRTLRFPEVRTIGYNGETGVNISLESKVTHSWAEVKDYYIPFLQRLTRRYKLYPYHESPKYDTDGNLVKKSPVFIAIGSDQYDYYPLEYLMNDEIRDKHEFYSISVKVGEKL